MGVYMGRQVTLDNTMIAIAFADWQPEPCAGEFRYVDNLGLQCVACGFVTRNAAGSVHTAKPPDYLGDLNQLFYLLDNIARQEPSFVFTARLFGGQTPLHKELAMQYTPADSDTRYLDRSLGPHEYRRPDILANVICAMLVELFGVDAMTQGVNANYATANG